MAAAIANIGFVKSEPPDELSSAANAEGETNNKSDKITPKDMLRKENFLLNGMHMITLFCNIKTCYGIDAIAKLDNHTQRCKKSINIKWQKFNLEDGIFQN